MKPLQAPKLATKLQIITTLLALLQSSNFSQVCLSNAQSMQAFTTDPSLGVELQSNQNGQ